MEAVIAAMFFDSGLEQSEKFIIENLKDAIQLSSENVGMKDHKTVLQEKLQENGNVDIRYEVVRTIGPDHNKTFIVQVSCNGKYLATGEGKTKKQAEMLAAKRALEQEK